jgi:hypothetical protein
MLWIGELEGESEFPTPTAGFTTYDDDRIWFLTCGFFAPHFPSFLDVSRSFAGRMRDESETDLGALSASGFPSSALKLVRPTSGAKIRIDQRHATDARAGVRSTLVS